MNPVQEYQGRGQLLAPGEPARTVAYRLTRHQGLAGNGLPVPGLFSMEGVLDFGGEAVPAELIGTTLTLRLDDGRAIAVTMTNREGVVRSQGHGPSRCLCC